MLIEIASLVLATTFLALSFFEPSRLSWKFAMLCLAPSITLSLYQIIGDQHDKDFAIKSLERIATRINWGESKLELELATDLEDLRTGYFGVNLKILPNELEHNGKEVVRTALKNHCHKDKDYDFFYLTEDQAKALFNTMLEPKGIYHAKEKAKGIEPFYYFGESIRNSSHAEKKVQFRLELGPNSKSDLSSLSELNNTIMVGQINAPASIELMPTWLYYNLDTNAGNHLLHFPIKTKDKIMINEQVRYIGMCFPENYFWSYPD
jgi:hypothetical protein